VLKTVKSALSVSSYTRRVGFIPNAEYADAFMAMLRRHRVKVDGYAQYVYHRCDEPDRSFDIELAVPVASPESHAFHKLEWQEEIMVRELPEVPMMASAVYQGSPYTIINALQSLGAWIEENGYTIVGPGRKVCLQWRGSLTNYITEMQFPVAQQVIGN
jgi:effector-binding domain-containing protein